MVILYYLLIILKMDLICCMSYMYLYAVFLIDTTRFYPKGLLKIKKIRPFTIYRVFIVKCLRPFAHYLKQLGGCSESP